MTGAHPQKNFYSTPELYDLAMGSYAAGDSLEFYMRQIARFGSPVLELACGTGRFAIPLAESGIDITGLDISEEMLALARLKASGRGVDIPLEQGDMRNFDLGRKFGVILIATQSLAHLHTREDVESFLASVHRHLAENGRLLIEIFNPSLAILSREKGRRYPVDEFIDGDTGKRVALAEEVEYDAAAQVNHIIWYFREMESGEETSVRFDMQQFFPREIDALLAYNGFEIENIYGNYDEQAFASDSPKQLLLCKATGR